MSYVWQAYVTSQVRVTASTILPIVRVLHLQEQQQGYMGDLVWLNARAQYKTLSLSGASEHNHQLRERMRPRKRELTTEDTLDMIINKLDKAERKRHGGDI